MNSQRIEPGDAFRKAYPGGGRNFMTPDVMGFGWIVPGEVAYEISRGHGIDGETIYGLTIVACVEGRWRQSADLPEVGGHARGGSRCCHSMRAVTTAIDEIKEAWNAART